MRLFAHHQNPNALLHLPRPSPPDTTPDLVKSAPSAVSRDVIYCRLQDCIKRKELVAGRYAYSLMIRVGFDSIPVLLDHVIRLFAACGSLTEASDVFSKISIPSVYTWNAMISGHANSDEYVEALELYHQMRRKNVIPDKYTFLSILKACNGLRDLGQIQLIHTDIGLLDLPMDVMIMTTLIDVYCKCGAINEARRLFDRLLNNRNIVSWGAMISGYTQHELYEYVLDLFSKMYQEGIELNRVIFLCVMKACSGTNTLHQGMIIHDQIVRNGFLQDVEIGNSLVDMYLKCGSMSEGARVFAQLSSPNVVSWSVLIAGYIRHGNCEEAIQCFDAMRGGGSKPDHVIFTSILTACTRACLWERGERYFICMMDEYGIVPDMEHYSCMIDLLCRAGRLTEAVSFLYSMPIETDSVLLTSILNSCRIYHSVELAAFVFDELFKLDPTNASIYLLMASIFSDAQMWEAAKHVHSLMISAGAFTKTGMGAETQAHELRIGCEKPAQRMFATCRLQGLLKSWKKV